MYLFNRTFKRIWVNYLIKVKFNLKLEPVFENPGCCCGGVWGVPPKTGAEPKPPAWFCARFPKLIVFWFAKDSNAVDCWVGDPNPPENIHWLEKTLLKQYYVKFSK